MVILISGFDATSSNIFCTQCKVKWKAYVRTQLPLKYDYEEISTEKIWVSRYICIATFKCASTSGPLFPLKFQVDEVLAWVRLFRIRFPLSNCIQYMSNIWILSIHTLPVIWHFWKLYFIVFFLSYSFLELFWQAVLLKLEQQLCSI